MSELTPDGRQRLVNDALKKSRFNPRVLNDGQKLQRRMETIINTCAAEIGAKVAPDRFTQGGINKMRLLVTVQTYLLDHFSEMSRDEVMYLLTMLLSKEVAEHVYNNA